MKSINQISGDLLLYFYSQHRKGTLDKASLVNFNGHPGREISLIENSNLTKSLLQITDGSSNDAYNALKYLEEKHFIEFKETGTNMGIHCHGLRLTAYGVDIIEGIEKSDKEKEAFKINFNIKLAENINIESLIKAELGSLIKASLI